MESSSGSSRDGPGFRGPRRFGGSKPFRPSPVKVGEEYDVKIESMSRRGDSGVARVQGLVVFVAGANVGDSVRIRITRVGSGYASADIVVAGKGEQNEEAVESLPPDAEAETSGDSDE
ncbi:TRAM domain-containing protein [Nitrososphaera sp.]|uniref:TRAM domain-containing protein n=1 Tax=Nitrososphaera sp. TaxID=1971748 RepID=UPI00307E44AC